MLASRFFLRKSRVATRAFSTKMELPPLPWEISSLEPVLSGYLLDYHYNKHHQTYVNNLNNLLQQAGEAKANKDYDSIVKLAPLVRFHGGGHINHTFFWHSLAPKAQGGGERPDEDSEFGKEVQKTWGSFDKLITDFNAKTAPLMGSGWGWVCWNKDLNSLEYKQTYNQDLITETAGLVPLLNIDVWEHAYYLDYKNARPDFLNEIWKVVNWQKVVERFEAARK